MIDDIKSRLIRVDGQIIQSKLFAEYWLAMATTGGAKQRKIHKGTSDGPELTDEEKIKDALNNALSHIHNIGDLYETKIKLEEEKCI